MAISAGRVSSLVISNLIADSSAATSVDALNQGIIHLPVLNELFGTMLSKKPPKSKTMTMALLWTWTVDLFSRAFESLEETTGATPGRRKTQKFAQDTISGKNDASAAEGKKPEDGPAVFRVKEADMYTKLGTSWPLIELCIEVKGSVEEDPFIDPLDEEEARVPAPTGSVPVSGAHAANSEDFEDDQRRPFSSSKVAIQVDASYPFERKTGKGKANRGQLTDYATNMWAYQHRVFFFQVFIFKDFARLLRYDRAGVIVSEQFRYQKTPYLAQFFSRFDAMSALQRGRDTSVSAAGPNEVSQAKAILPSECLDDSKELLKILVHDKEGVKELIISTPCFNYPSAIGRGTRCYVAADIATGRRVFLKDSWRTPGSNQLQATVTAKYAKRNWAIATTKLEEHQHYRLVLDVIGEPLDKAPSSRAIVKGILDALIAHWEAFDKAKILHRDLSPGNIIFTETGHGILIDWDLCRSVDSQEAARIRGHTGTWQFISYELLQDPEKQHSLQDDLQSAFWILLYICYQFIPSTVEGEALDAG
ncbi:hypothetical protein GLOTRDRAFT_134358 [Gloeophyllum trabeum ATCC 11539]|uniref:Protein kinase domain-containing protein n=1 Tax=Gloeophyllum trabeum (strain ATCC 11539 / FP-39264 / Madison 617) TaxID=670483 RepID=S7R6K9_GLOTA|nr:uncharacterized protein GLOTRDRAFT_134358 [Gloeophyllum trabeum ATCC 11539]EPQ50000.1 hypothetical protein GLOTRDRAFT_134358 [Gloeophyllum trabeum ATCC 11539]